jgi:hypothetical protein
MEARLPQMMVDGQSNDGNRPRVAYRDQQGQIGTNQYQHQYESRLRIMTISGLCFITIPTVVIYVRDGRNVNAGKLQWTSRSYDENSTPDSTLWLEF